MRLFQQQTVHNSLVEDPTTTTALPPAPPPPPFLPDQEEERRLSLLRESTTHLREGRHRLPTPDRVAIMDLSSSFQKRRLGKQQQILSEITQRCREQEVTDLSSTISAKVQLKKTSEGAGEEGPAASMYTSSVSTRMPHVKPARPQHKLLHGASLSTGDLRDLDSVEKRVKSEKAYKFFPARKIMRRQPTRLQLITSTLLKPGTTGVAPGTGTGAGGGGGGLSGRGGGSTYREPPTTVGTGSRFSIDFLKGVRPTDPEARAEILERQTINGSIQLQHYLQPKLDAMAPLLLPDLYNSLDVGGGGGGGGGVGDGGMGVVGGVHDRLDTYFTSSRLPLNQRSRSFFDTSSISGRSFRSMYTAGHHHHHRPTGSRHHLRSKRSERGAGVAHVLPVAAEDDDDNDDGGDNLGNGGVGVPMDLKNSASAAFRPGSQRV
ncbi:uncharacterized protein LOC143283349 [Babylonia areolata]|uniref:uncharacterized protein LOC143283349 n=1 Tax=Babylonia areolata TaxID=304850 RepID=UPI003FD0DB9E